MSTDKQSLEDLGYRLFFESARIELGDNDFKVARVISRHRDAYQVLNANGEFLARITGRQIFQATSKEDFPAVGDWVVITETDNDGAVINGVLPRLTIIKRRHGDNNRSGRKETVQVMATNVDVGFVVASIDRDYNLNRLARYLEILTSGRVKGVIVLNKVDLLTEDEKESRLKELKTEFPDVDILITSTVDEEMLTDLKKYITPGQTYCFLGSSGVGKSSLINSLIGEEIIETDEISSYSGRGKHTTTRRQMYFLDNGGIVIDNPGIRDVEVVKEDTADIN